MSHSRDAPADVWATVRTYEDLLRVNKGFIRGDHPCSYYFRSPLAADADIDKLSALHDRGMLTVDGQGGVRDRGTPTYRDWVDIRGRPRGDWFVDTDQKPYLSFFVPAGDAPTLLKPMFDSPDLEWFVTDLATKQRASNSVRRKVYVTRERCGKTSASLARNTWSYLTAIAIFLRGVDAASTFFGLYAGVQETFAGRPFLFVSVAGTTYGSEAKSPEAVLLGL